MFSLNFIFKEPVLIGITDGKPLSHGVLNSQQIREVVLGEWDLEHDPDCAGDEG